MPQKLFWGMMPCSVPSSLPLCLRKIKTNTTTNCEIRNSFKPLGASSCSVPRKSQPHARSFLLHPVASHHGEAFQWDTGSHDPQQPLTKGGRQDGGLGSRGPPSPLRGEVGEGSPRREPVGHPHCLSSASVPVVQALFTAELPEKL